MTHAIVSLFLASVDFVFTQTLYKTYVISVWIESQSLKLVLFQKFKKTIALANVTLEMLIYVKKSWQ